MAWIAEGGQDREGPLAVEGRLVVISLIGGARAELNLNTIMSKRLRLTGSTLRIRTVH